MAEKFVPNPDANDGTFVSENILFDSHPKEPEVASDTGPMSQWDRLYQERIESLNPDEKLLDPEEVAQLEANIKAGKQAAALLEGGVRHPTKAKLTELAQQVNNAQGARDALVVSHLRFAAWFVRETMDFNKQHRQARGERGPTGKFVRDLNTLSGSELDYDDRMQLASLGLLRAAEAHDPTKGSFSGYAMYCMEGELLREMAKDQSPLKIGTGRSAEISRLKRAIDDFEKKGIYEPTNDQLAEALNIYTYHAAYLRDLMVSRQRISFEQVEAEVAKDLDREDKLHNVEQPESLADQLPDSGVDRTLADEAALSELGYRLDQALAELSEREQRIIELRFGLEDNEPMTYEQIGREFGVTLERIRQIESQAMAKLRNPIRKTGLADFISSDEDPTLGQRAEITLSEGQNAALGVLPPHHAADTKPGQPVVSGERKAGHSYKLEQLPSITPLVQSLAGDAGAVMDARFR